MSKPLEESANKTTLLLFVLIDKLTELGIVDKSELFERFDEKYPELQKKLRQSKSKTRRKYGDFSQN